MNNLNNKKNYNLLIVNSAIKSMDAHLYNFLRKSGKMLSEDEMILCLLIKYRYSNEELELFTGLSGSKLTVIRKNVYKKLEIKNEKQLRSLFNKFIIKKEKKNEI